MVKLYCATIMYRPEYNQTKLSHAEKCKRADQLEHNSSEPHSKFTWLSYFFCGETTIAESCAEHPQLVSILGSSMCHEIARKKLYLLAKLSAWDLIAQGAMYNLHCLVSLYNHARGTKPTSDTDPDALNHWISFAELVSYIEEHVTLRCMYRHWNRTYTLFSKSFMLPDWGD